MIHKLTIQDIPLKGKRVLMRVDFNVPLQENGNISDDSRIKESLPSIKYILKHGASLVLMSHLGRPKGKKDPKFSLTPCAKKLSEFLKKNVQMAPDCIGSEVEKMAKELHGGEVLLLENLRFHEAEENPDKDPSFAQKLARLGDIYVNDAFGSAHRKHSSTYSIVNYFPSKALSGFLMDKEIAFLGELVENPKRPYYAILGGAKVSTKVGLIQNLISKLDGLFLGGAMAFTFLNAQGMNTGSSLVEKGHLETARNVLKACTEKGVKCYLPVDLVIAKDANNEAERKIISIAEGIPEDWQGMDIGPKTISEWRTALHNAATIFWNGPLGAFEMPNFAHGTRAIAETISNIRATKIVGGGDSVAAIHQFGFSEHFTHLSTGGGASLEFLEFGHLPGVDVLSDR